VSVHIQSGFEADFGLKNAKVLTLIKKSIILAIGKIFPNRREKAENKRPGRG